MTDQSNCCFRPKFSQEKDLWGLKYHNFMKIGRILEIKWSLVGVEEIYWKFTEPELLDKTLLPWLQTEKIFQTTF